MKAYTDLEQSKKLSKILPIESADMFYYKDAVTKEDTPRIMNFLQVPKLQSMYYSPCWSLTALLNVIPKPDLVQNSEGTWLVHSWVNAYPWSVGGYSNPIDACYEIVLKLHKLNLL